MCPSFDCQKDVLVGILMTTQLRILTGQKELREKSNCPIGGPTFITVDSGLIKRKEKLCTSLNRMLRSVLYFVELGRK